MTTGRINQVTIPALGFTAKRLKNQSDGKPHAPKCAEFAIRAFVTRQCEFSFKEHSHHRKRPIKIIWTNPHQSLSPPLHLCGLKTQYRKRRERAISGSSFLSPRTHNLGYRISQSNRDWNHRPKRETASELVGPHVKPIQVQADPQLA